MTYKLSDKLEANLRIGKHCIVKNDRGEYCIISPFKDITGDYRVTGAYSSPEVACKYIGEIYGEQLTYYDKNFEWVGTYTPEYEGLKKGQKVKLRDGTVVWKVEDFNVRSVYVCRLSDGYCARVNPDIIEEVIVDGEDKKKEPVKMTRAEIAQKLGIEGEFEIID